MHNFEDCQKIKVIPFVFYELYEVQDIYEACYAIFMQMVINDIRVKQCKCCNKFFIYKDKAEKYCDRIYKSNKTCKDLGYLLKVESDELLKLYNTAYKTKHAQKQRHTRNKSKATKDKYENALTEWRSQAKTKLDEYQNKYNILEDETEKQNIIKEFKEFLEISLDEFLEKD